MARHKMTQLPLDLPDDYDRKKIRPWLTAPNCEEVKRKYFTPASRRTIRETWPLEWRYADGYAVTARDPFLDECERRLAEAPVIMGGKRPAPEYDAASPLSIEPAAGDPEPDVRPRRGRRAALEPQHAN